MEKAMAASSSQPETMKAECSLDNPKTCYSESSDPVLRVTLLGGEWGSSAGGLSTINRELAIHLSNHSAVKVSLLVPQGACNTEEIREADGYGITIVEAKERAAFDRLDWLSSPPKDHVMDIVVGHGVKLGRQVQFIRDSARFPNCKWVQVVHTAPEDLSRYKCYSDPISKGETKHESEVELCKLADLVVPVGPRLKEAYTSYLQRYKTGQDVLSVTPGLFQREFGDLIQTRNEHAEFKVLLFGRGDDEDFELKGYNIAAQAFTDRRLKNKPYHLIFVGAPEGKQEKVREKLLQREIAEAQLTVRKFLQSREKLKDLLCEADLAIMPSKSEGFGLVALEALSAGLPILVGSKSGFAKALENVLHGDACIVNSDDPAEWAKAIEAVRIRHGMRLQEIKSLRASYEEMYSWKEQCEALVNRMWKMSHEDSLKARSSLETKCNVCQRMEGMTEDHEEPSIAIYNNQRTNSYDGKQLVSETSLSSDCEIKADAASGYQTKISTDTGCQSQSRRELKMSGFSCNPDSVVITALIEVLISLNTQDLTVAQQRILKEELERSVHKYRRLQDLSSLPVDSTVARLTEFLKKAFEVAVMMVKSGSLIITVQCLTLESLESLWNGYCSGYLNDIVERFLVTDEIKRKLGMDNVRLKTTIEEENYLICKKAFIENSEHRRERSIIDGPGGYTQKKMAEELERYEKEATKDLPVEYREESMAGPTGKFREESMAEAPGACRKEPMEEVPGGYKGEPMEEAFSVAEVPGQYREELKDKAPKGFKEEQVEEPLGRHREEPVAEAPGRNKEEAKRTFEAGMTIFDGSRHWDISLRLAGNPWTDDTAWAQRCDKGLEELGRNAVTFALESLGHQVTVVRPTKSVLVELHCYTKESFVSFMDDLESGKVKRRLEEEFGKIGYEGELEVTIINENDVYRALYQIRAQMAMTKSMSVVGETPVTIANAPKKDVASSVVSMVGEDTQTMCVLMEDDVPMGDPRKPDVALTTASFEGEQAMRKDVESEKAAAADDWKILYGLCGSANKWSKGFVFSAMETAHSASKAYSSVNSRSSWRALLNPFQELLERLSQEIEEEQLESLKFMLENHIPAGPLEKCKTARILFKCMKQKGLLGYNNLDFLEKLLTEAQRSDLVEIVKDFKLQPAMEIDSGYPAMETVRFSIASQRQHFNELEFVIELINSMILALRIDPSECHFIKCEEIASNWFNLMFELPNRREVVDKLCLNALEKEPWLAQCGVKAVKIGGKPEIHVQAPITRFLPKSIVRADLPSSAQDVSHHVRPCLHDHQKLDLIVVVDCATTNSAILGQLKTQLRHMVDDMSQKSVHFRLAIISYQNHPNIGRRGQTASGSNIASLYNFTDDKSKMKENINSLRCFGSRGSRRGLADGLALAVHLTNNNDDDDCNNYYKCRQEALKVCVLLPLEVLVGTLDIFKCTCTHGHDVLSLCRQLSANAVALYVVMRGWKPEMFLYLSNFRRLFDVMAEFFTGISLMTGGQYIYSESVKLVSEIISYVVEVNKSVERLFGTAHDIILDEIEMNDGDVVLEELLTKVQEELTKRSLHVNLITINRSTIGPSCKLARKFSLDDSIDTACKTWQRERQRRREADFAIASGTPGDFNMEEAADPQVQLLVRQNVNREVSERMVRRVVVRREQYRPRK